MLTSDVMREMWPHGDAKVPGLTDGIAALAPAVFPKYNLTSDLLIAHAMAQFATRRDTAGVARRIRS